MTQQSVNKDLLIDVLTKQNDALKQLNKAQEEQLNNYRENIAAYKVLSRKMSEQEQTQEKLISNQEKLLVGLREEIESLKKLDETHRSLTLAQDWYISLLEQEITKLGGELPSKEIN